MDRHAGRSPGAAASASHYVCLRRMGAPRCPVDDESVGPAVSMEQGRVGIKGEPYIIFAERAPAGPADGGGAVDLEAGPQSERPQVPLDSGR